MIDTVSERCTSVYTHSESLHFRLCHYVYAGSLGSCDWEVSTLA